MSSLPIPLRYEGEGEFKTPPKTWRARCDKEFVIGQLYMMAPMEERSEASHKHEFAWLREAWSNLSETLAAEYPTAEHLRKRALIQGGFFDEQIIDAGSNAAALRVSTGVRAFAGEAFSMVFVRGPFVVIRRAKSQSRRAMSPKEFQDSKTKILEIVAEMIGTSPETLTKANAA